MNPCILFAPLKINYSQGVWVMKLRSGVMKVDGGYFHFRLAIGQAIFK